MDTTRGRSGTRRDRWWRCAALVVVVATVSTCGGDDPPVEATGQAGPVDEVPARFFPAGAGSYAWTVATADHLVGLGRPPDGESGSWGEALALDGGEVTTIDEPPGEGLRFSPTEVTALDDSVVVSGYRCLEDVLEDERCPVRVSSYRVEPTTGEWTELDVPEAVTSSTESTTRFLQSSGSSAVALFGTGEGVSRLLVRLEGDSWRVVAEVPSSERLTCATDDTLVQLVEAEVPPNVAAPDAIDPVTFTARVIDLATGDAVEVDVPPLLGGFGGVGVVLGCNARSAYVATSPGNDVESGVHRLVGESWEPVAEAFDQPDVMLGDAISGGAAGPAVIAVVDDSGGASKTSHTIAFDLDGGLHRFTGDTFDCYVFWRGRSGQAVVIGPYGAEEGVEEGPVTVAVRHEVVS